MNESNGRLPIRRRMFHGVSLVVALAIVGYFYPAYAGPFRLWHFAATLVLWLPMLVVFGGVLDRSVAGRTICVLTGRPIGLRLTVYLLPSLPWLFHYWTGVALNSAFHWKLAIAFAMGTALGFEARMYFEREYLESVGSDASRLPRRR